MAIITGRELVTNKFWQNFNALYLSSYSKDIDRIAYDTEKMILAVTFKNKTDLYQNVAPRDVTGFLWDAANSNWLQAYGGFLKNIKHIAVLKVTTVPMDWMNGHSGIGLNTKGVPIDMFEFIKWFTFKIGLWSQSEDQKVSIDFSVPVISIADQGAYSF